MLSYQSLLKYNALYFSHYYFETGYSFSPGLLKVLRFLNMRGVLLRQERNGRLIGLVGLSCGTMSDVVYVGPVGELSCGTVSDVVDVEPVGMLHSRS